MTILAIAFTPNYYVPAATMLRSLLDSSPQGLFRVVCLVNEEIPKNLRDELIWMGDGRLSFEYVDMKGKLKEIYIDPRYTEAASFRLLLPELLPQYKSIVYIDCDVIVRQDIDELYNNISLKDNYIAAVYEAPIENQAERFKALGCDPNKYFNSGFLIMNLEKMREDKVSEKLVEACKVPYLEFPDQDALNKICQGHVLPLDPVYNGIRTFFLPQYKADFLKQYSEEQWDAVQKSGTIHYTGGKPWDILTVQFDKWWRTYESLPYQISEQWIPPKYKFWKFYKIKPIGATIEFFRSLKRIFK